MVVSLRVREHTSADRILLSHPVVLHKVVQAGAGAVHVGAGHGELLKRMQPRIELLLLQRRLLTLAFHVLRRHRVMSDPT